MEDGTALPTPRVHPWVLKIVYPTWWAIIMFNYDILTLLGFTMFHPFSANQNTESLRYFWVNLHGDQQPFSHCSRRSSVEAFAACWISAPRRQKPNVGRLLHEKNGGLNGLNGLNGFNGKIIWLVLLCATLSILNNWSFCDIHRSTI